MIERTETDGTTVHGPEFMNKTESAISLAEQTRALLVETRHRINAARQNSANRAEFFDYKPYTVTEEVVGERVARINEFNEENDAWSRVWHGESCNLDRQVEIAIYEEGKKRGAKTVRVLKIKCIDGRKPRPIEGEADSTKTEEAKIALDKIPSSGKIIPLQNEICLALEDLSMEPLEISLAHYDSYDVEHGCAAIKRLMNDADIFREELSGFLSIDEMELLLRAQERGLDEANLVLLELTNNRAFLNIRNEALKKAGLKEVERIAVPAMFDTRTMGMELRSPLLEEDPQTGKTILSPIEKREVLSTTPLANQLKDAERSINTANFPDFGALEHTFNTVEGFVDYSRKLTIMSIFLNDPQEPNKYIKTFYQRVIDFPEQLTQAAADIHDKVSDFIEKYFPDLSEEARRVLKYRFYRSIAHQYLTGLSEHKEHHPFSDHAEAYIATSEDANYPGKLVASKQSFRISCPDEQTGAKRTNIAASVMDGSQGLDQGKPHIWYVSTSIKKRDFDNRLSPDPKDHSEYQEAIKKNTRFLRGQMRQPLIKRRVYEGNLQPVPVLVDKDTNEVLEILTGQVVYI